ncbi:MAG: penicillin-binding protein 1A [Gammaproteobacteria bacterium]|nr:penicillin-binding protein 1A [Gammaproteobacteria bacterium]
MNITRRLLRLIALGVMPVLLAVLGAYLYIQPSMPTVQELRDIHLQTPLRVYSQDGALLAVYGTKRRIPVRLDEIPLPMRQAFIASEDSRFEQHFGVDLQALVRAAVDLARSGRIRQGGSTITMQLARNFYLTRQRHFIRKLREIFLALRIEQELSKDEILELYLNKIFLGHRAYGVGAAAEVYYDASPRHLTLAQMATIAGLPKAPSTLNPVTNPDASHARRRYVLDRMLQDGHITSAQHREAVEAPVTARLGHYRGQSSAPYVGEMVRAEMVERFGTEAYTGGYTVYLTIRDDLQTAARQAVRRALIRYDLRHGWRGAENRLVPLPESKQELDQVLSNTPARGGFKNGIVVHAGSEVAHVYLGHSRWAELTLEEILWARPMEHVDRRGPAPRATSDVLHPGDIVHLVFEDNVWRLRQIPEASGALVALDPVDGAIRALTGGFDFALSKFNRATQARRQPGSSFKPFLYTAALAKGYTPGTLINDAPVVYHDQGIEGAWRPANYSGRFYGPTRLREALTYSRNVVSIRMLDGIGSDYARHYVERFGFDAEALPDNLTLALGSGEVAPLQMVAAFAIFANGGYQIEPYLIDRIENRAGKLVYAANPRKVCDDACQKQALSSLSAPDQEISALMPENAASRVIDKRIHYQIVSMLQDVVRFGTARAALALEREDLAGKTGTTNDQRDAWFSGFNSGLVATTWVGRDDYGKLGRREVGGTAALPMWVDFMKVALADLPEKPLSIPPGIVQVRIDPKNGLLAPPDSTNSIVETFREEHVPNRLSKETNLMPGDGRADMPEQLF